MKATVLFRTASLLFFVVGLTGMTSPSMGADSPVPVVSITTTFTVTREPFCDPDLVPVPCEP